MNNRAIKSLLMVMLVLALMVTAMSAFAEAYLDNNTIYPSSDPNNESRRSDHFRINFGHYNRDTGTPVTEQLVQGNLQMFEHLWQRNIVELGLNDMGQSAILEKRDGNKYRTNFNILMTWNDGGGGGAYMSMDGNGYSFAMANSGYCRYDPPSGATPHELGHAWEGQARGFNGSTSSGAWWECTANWFQLQLLNSYPTDGIIWNGMYYPVHGRDYYGCFTIWEAFREDPRYGGAFINQVWTDATPDQQANEYIIDRMVRLDSSGSADKAGASRDMWGDIAKKRVTWDFERQKWFAQENSAEDGSDWYWYQRCRTPLVKMPGTTGIYRPERSHIPMEYGFNIIPLTCSPNTTVSCNFQPMCDPVRQSDWRVCLVAVNNSGEAKYSVLWNKGNNSIILANDDTKLFLVVTPTPKPMAVWAWDAYRNDAGLQFPYAVSFTNATPKNIVYPAYTGTHSHHANGGGLVQSGATVAATAYVGPNAQVLNGAKVNGYASIEDYAVVKDNAIVEGNAVVSGHAIVQDSAHVYGNAKVRDWARVFGNAQVYDNAKVIEHANCGDNGNVVSGSAVIKGTTYVYSPSTFSGSIIVDGDTANGGTGDHGVHFGWQWGQNQSIFTNLTENNYVYAQHSFERENAVFAWDEYGINQGFLINGCRDSVDTVAPTRGGRVLPLDGVSQYVELHNSVNDFKDTAITIWAKWTGSASDQRIWSMGNGSTKYMYLTPQDASTGKLRFVITNGTTTQYLEGASAMPANTWTHIAVVFSGSTSTLYVNGASVATVAASAILPDALNAPLMENANYLGRGNAGNYFQGYLDDFRVYSKTLTSAEISAIYSAAAPAPVTITADTAAPTPDAATWLVAPAPVALTFDPVTKLPLTKSDNSITMSATPGTDASNWVEYYFQCTSGGGHDSGWVSFHKYTDVGLTPGVTYTYTVKMRDKNGNTTATSAAASAATMVSSTGAATFAYGPIGIADGQVTMTATKLNSSSGFAEYNFTMMVGTGTIIGASGWQSSPKYTFTSGMTTGSTYSYNVQVRDGRGHTSSISGRKSASAKDMAAPKLPITVANWGMMPYATIDNRISMTAGDASDPAGVQYYFECVSGGGANSGWQDSTTYVTDVLANGTYQYRYKTRDKSAQLNESGYSTTYSATITPTTGFHNYSFSQLSALPDDYLVTFSGVVMRINAGSYLIKDTASSATIIVRPNSYGEATDASLALKVVTVKGHLYTYNNVRQVTYADVTATGTPANSVSGKVTNASGVGIAGATVYFSDIANPSGNPITTATTDASGNYTKGLTDGTWFVAAGAVNYIFSADQSVTINGANIQNINFTLAATPRVTGKVTKKSDGSAITGATVYFSKTPNASASPTYTITTDASGNYNQGLQPGTWYVSASATSFYPSPDLPVTITTLDVANINFVLKANLRNIPRPDDLLFSAVTEDLPAGGLTGDWKTYLPAGSTLTSIGWPTVEILNGIKWEKNTYGSPNWDGFRQGSYSAPIAINGASIVVAARPVRNSIATSWISIVDVMYDRLLIGIRNNTGKVVVRRNGSFEDSATAIPDGQTTILSLVVQPTGQYEVYANGTRIMNNTSTSDMTSFNPKWNGGNTGYWSYINVGRNEPDGWTTFNGNIGDVFLYKVALTSAERLQIEADVMGKFTGSNIVATASNGGTISPSGVIPFNSGDNQTYAIAALPGYLITDVKVDGVSQGAIATYTFTNITTSHTIAATFAPANSTITATAGAGGTITPSGAVSVNNGANQLFTLTPNPGYAIATLKVDGIAATAASSYTFNNVIANHTIDATFTKPVGINNKSAITDAKAQGRTVKVWGKVTSINGTTSFVINDGYDSTGITIMLNGAQLPVPFTTTSTAIVTGVLSKAGSNPVVYAQKISAQ